MLSIGAVVLAAGLSTRMGDNKLLLEAGGEKMIVTTVTRIASLELNDIVVVTGHQSDQLKRALQSLPVRFVVCEAFSDGMGCSLSTGIGALPETTDGALVGLGDMPFVEVPTMSTLLHQFEEKAGRCIVVPTFDGRRGHPVIFPRLCFAEIAKLKGDVGARAVVRHHSSIVEEVPVDSDTILRDVDDLAAASRWGYTH